MCFPGISLQEFACDLALAALNCRQFAVGNFNIVYQVDEESRTVGVVAISYFRRLTDFIAERC